MHIRKRETIIGLVFAIIVAIFINYPSVERLLEGTAALRPRAFSPLLFSLVWFCVVSMLNYLLYVVLFNLFSKRHHPVWMILSLIGATIILSYFFVELHTWIRDLFIPEGKPRFRGGGRHMFEMARGFNSNLFKHALIALLNLLFVYIQRLLYTNQQLQLESVKSQHSALVQQINPHFFFNSLGSLRYSIISDTPDHAVELLDNLTAIFRNMLKINGGKTHSLAEELELTQSYIHVIEKRFKNKIFVEFQIKNTLLDSSLPPLSLLSLIENVIKHNQVSIKNPLTIKIYTNTDNALVVENLIIPKFEPIESHGIGLINLNKQYELLTGKGITIEKENNRFKVSLPLIQDHV